MARHFHGTVRNVIEQLGQVFAALIVSAFVVFLLEKLWAGMDGPDTYIRTPKRKPFPREYRDLTQTPELRRAVMRALLDKPDPVARFLADERPAWEAVADLEAALDDEMRLDDEWSCPACADPALNVYAFGCRDCAEREARFDGMDTERTWR